MNEPAIKRRTGVLVSGGLDSGILIGHLLAQGLRVQPFYIQSHLYWQRAEEHALRKFLRAMNSPQLDTLVALELPLADLYGSHWSITGKAIPDGRSADEAVFLPGRNALLIIKAALWCQLHGIESLALATLGTNPFADSSDEFFGAIEQAFTLAESAPLQIVRPFGQMTKEQVMTVGAELPLELTFSCIDPVGNDHCGKCNKCAERRGAFASIALRDPTRYAYPQKSPGPAGPGSVDFVPSNS